MKKEKRIPTILGLILLIGSIVGGVILTQRQATVGTKAGGDCTPINPQVTNITNSSFTVSFSTSADCLSTINVDNRTISDLRFLNTGRTEKPSKIHYFEVTNLKENTPYTYSFVNNGVNYSQASFKTQTASKPPAAIPTANLAWGRVFMPDLKPADEAILYLSIPGASPLSAFVTSRGNWNISLATSFNDAKNNWFTPPNGQIEDIVVISPDGTITQIASNTSRNNPVPDIIIGQNQFSPQPVTDYTTGELNQMDQTSLSLVDKDLSIDNPEENEPVFTLRPDFFGKGPVNTIINIQIDSTDTVNGQATTKTDGTWNWSPPQDLKPGTQTITVSAVNPKTSSTDTVSRKFTIIITDNNVGMAFTASQSGTVQTPTPSLIPTTTPTTAPTNAPTPMATATSVPTQAPTPTEKPIVAQSTTPTPRPTIPEAGFSTPTIIIVALSLILFIVSFVM